MDPGHIHEPTVDDLRVKLCYICREEERHDNPPHPPPVWTHPCKCTLVAHESCLLHWIKTQQRDFGRSRGDLKCPQCGELYEFEGFNPVVLRIFNTVNRTLSRSGRFVTACSVGTIVLSSGAGVYLTCMSYGAFAVREFLGPDIFQTLLTTNPANWPLHAWFYLPMVPFSLIVSRTPLVFWSTSPLVPLLFPWPSTIPVSAAGAVSRRMRVGPFAGRPALWPPPPALVCALFPIVRVLYGRLRDRVVRAMVQDLVPTRVDAAQRRQQRRIEQGRPEHQRRGNQQNIPQRLQRQHQEQLHQQPQQQHQHQQQQLPPGAARRFQFQVGEQFAFEIAHIVLDHNAPAQADAPGPAPAVAVGDIAANGGGGAAADNPENQQQQQQQQPAQGRRPLPPAPVGQERRPLPLAPVGQEPQRQRPLPELQQQRAEPGQEQGQEPAAAPRDENDLGAVAARAIRVTGASLGRLIGGALLMPSIARMMGSMLLHISHVVPLVRTIIAPLPPLPPMPQPQASPSGPISALVGLIRGARDFGPRPDAALRDRFGGTTHVGGRGLGGWLSGGSLSATLLRGFLATSEEWATRDPVWWRNALGLGIFLVVKDGLKILHLWLAKRELEERHIKSKSFAGIDLTGLDLVERQEE